MPDAVGSVSASAGGPTFVVCAYIPQYYLFKERRLSAGLEGDSVSRSTAAQELAATDIHTHIYTNDGGTTFSPYNTLPSIYFFLSFFLSFFFFFFFFILFFFQFF
jgi:hypothetical protein